MASTIDKLFKNYSVKEIEEILFKASLNTDKRVTKPYPAIQKSSKSKEKRLLLV